MDFDTPEIVETLQLQRRFHQEQLRLIDIALSAIESAKRTPHPATRSKKRQPDGIKKHRIQWTREIGRLLDDYDEFNIIDLQNDLAEKRGIPSATTVTGRNVISNTLSRFVKRGRIQQIGPGFYKVICESI